MVSTTESARHNQIVPAVCRASHCGYVLTNHWWPLICKFLRSGCCSPTLEERSRGFLVYAVGTASCLGETPCSPRPSLCASLACLALYRMMCTMTRFLSGCLCLSQRAAHARWGPSDFAPQVPMKLWLTSGCSKSTGRARAGHGHELG